MSIWKTPIVYVGLGLLLIVGALTLGPWFVNWNGYRAGLEAWGGSLTGRKVVISGDISARLFPWPSLRVEGLRIANPDGARVADLLRAEAVEADLLLGPLLSGQLTVSGITISRPVIGLERLADGSAGFLITPQPGASLPRNISFENITISDGTLLLADGQDQGAAREFNGLDASLSAPSLAGPWKLRAGFDSQLGRVAFSASTAEYESGKPLAFGMRLRPATGAGFELGFDGQTAPSGFTGKLAAGPVDDPANPEGKASPGLRVKADVQGDLQSLTLSNIEASDLQSAANIITGKASLALGATPKLKAELGAAHFDLTGTKPDGLAMFLGLIPQSVAADVSLSFGNLLVAGATLSDVSIKASLAEGLITFAPAKAVFPGQTATEFVGSLPIGTGSGELSGKLSLQSKSMRDFLGWLLPGWRAAMDEGWKGQRGELSLQGRLRMDAEGYNLSDADFDLDGAKGTLALSPGSLRIVMGTLDIDRYAPGGIRASTAAGLFSHAAAQALKDGTAQLALQADKLLLNGVAAEDIAIDAAVSADALELRTLDIGSVEGARMEIAAVLNPDAKSPSGSATVNVQANEPKGLLRLLGLIPPMQAGLPDPAWADGVAPLNITLKADVDGKDGLAVIRAEAKGAAGGAKLSGSLDFSGELARWRLGETRADLLLESPSSQALARLFGLPAPGADDAQPASLAFTASGKPASGLESALKLDGFGGKSTLNGAISVSEENRPRATGVLEINAAQGNAIIAAAGLPASDQPVPVAGDGRLTWQPGALALKGFAGEIGGQKMSGDFAYGADGLTASLKADEVSLPFLMSALLLRADRSETTMTTLFADAPLNGSKAKLSIEAARLLGGLDPFVLAKARVEAMADGRKLEFRAIANVEGGGPIEMRFAAEPDNGALKADGTIKAELPLAVIDPGLAGRVTVDGKFTGSGRSPAGLLLALSGAGEMGLDAQFSAVNPKALTDAVTEKAFSQALAGPFRQGVLKPGALKGPFTIADGTIAAAAMAFPGGSFAPQFSFHEGKIDSVLKLDVREGAPPLEVIWAGVPGALGRSEDAGAYLAALTSKAMQEEIRKLEALQAEQQRLLEEEQKRAEEEARKRAEEEARRKAEEAARAKAAAELAKKLEEEAAARIAAEQAAKSGQPQQTPPIPAKKPLILYPTNPYLIETAPLPAIRP